jgi:hypothetical protein
MISYHPSIHPDQIQSSLEGSGGKMIEIVDRFAVCSFNKGNLSPVFYFVPGVAEDDITERVSESIAEFLLYWERKAGVPPDDLEEE